MKSKICPRYLISTIPAELEIDSQAGGDNKKQEQNKKFVSVSMFYHLTLRDTFIEAFQ